MTIIVKPSKAVPYGAWLRKLDRPAISSHAVMCFQGYPRRSCPMLVLLRISKVPEVADETTRLPLPARVSSSCILVAAVAYRPGQL